MKRLTLKRERKLAKTAKVPYTVHYRYHKKAICGQKRAYADTHLFSVITCKRCKKVIRGMLRG